MGVCEQDAYQWGSPTQTPGDRWKAQAHPQEEEVRVRPSRCQHQAWSTSYPYRPCTRWKHQVPCPPSIKETSRGALNAVPARPVSLMSSTMPQTTNWCEPRLWSRTPSLSLMLLLSDSGTKAIMPFPSTVRREPK